MRWQKFITPEARREATRLAREARIAKRLERVRARAALEFATLTPADLGRLTRAIEQERVARLQFAALEAARKRREARA